MNILYNLSKITSLVKRSAEFLYRYYTEIENKYLQIFLKRKVQNFVFTKMLYWRLYRRSYFFLHLYEKKIYINNLRTSYHVTYNDHKNIDCLIIYAELRYTTIWYLFKDLDFWIPAGGYLSTPELIPQTNMFCHIF